MNKVLLIASLALSTSAFAGTGSLWCADSSYGTPTEVATAMATPYSLVQIDKMNNGEIQIDIQDIYNSTSKVIKAKLATKTKLYISDIEIGNYIADDNFALAVQDGKIAVRSGSTTYNCEIPGDYKVNYSNDVIYSYKQL